jgi:hypothetical protein
MVTVLPLRMMTSEFCANDGGVVLGFPFPSSHVAASFQLPVPPIVLEIHKLPTLRPSVKRPVKKFV